MNKTNKISLTI